MPILFLIIAILFLLALSAFFSASETASMSLSRSQVKRMKGGSFSDRIVFALLQKPQKLLATVLIGNMFVNNLLTLLCGMMVESAAQKSIGFLPDSSLRSKETQELVAILFNIALVTPLLMIFGELTPKSIAHRHSAVIARMSAPLLKFAGWLMTPVLAVFKVITSACQWLLRIPQDSNWDMLTRDEVDATLSASVHDGAASIPAREILQRIFRFNDIEASEIMIPRTQLEGLDDSMTLQEAAHLIRKSSHNFLPVFHEDLDDLWGVALFTDYPLWQQQTDSSQTLADYREQIEQGKTIACCPVYPITFIPPSAKIAHVLDDMKLKPQRVIAVVGEYGGTLGVVTMNSIIEEIIGRFAAKDKGNGLVQVSQEKYLADGMTRRRVIEETIGEIFDDMESDTIGGLVMEKLGELPRKHGVFADIGKFRFYVAKIKDKRIEKVAIVPLNLAKQEND